MAVKRRRYQDGGPVQDMPSQTIQSIYRSGKSPTADQSQRYSAAKRAVKSADENEAGDTAEDRTTRPLDRANYAGFRKGGKVGKVVKRARR